MSIAVDDVLNTVREHAYRSLDPLAIGQTNLSLDRRVREEGEALGPAFQELRATRPSILVFVDDAPLANFGHHCRYLLYDAISGEHYASLAARFPPWIGSVPESMENFHTPVQAASADALFHLPPPYLCPIFIFPEGTRYAIFYSGMSNTRHLNDMEFGYRTLVYRYGFDPANITVLSYDGTTDTQDGSNTIWPGDGTAYQIKVDGQGDQAAFETAIDALKPKLGAEDVLFIHTNNHGDNFGSGSFLCEYPNWGTFLATDFCAKLGELPTYRNLLVMMEQCNSGGFIAPILASSTAAATSVACAAIATQSSYASPDGLWDSFARDWFAGQNGSDPYGAALAFNPDTNGDGRIEATEAFNYANTVRNPSDSPQYGDSGTPGGDIWLGQTYRIWWWWCWILREVLEPRYRELPEGEYYRELREIEPQFRELMESIEAQSNDLRREMSDRVRGILGR
jgi:hypothetical protein